ncbi:SDR family NAD(P)-dependent oxidoreductase [Streptomyces sclerotialus]|uniref:SDR family NAD(P)-dependent oxidoreductase n=1 Tax=Streptomyces sclerotialus TaxID=1957 RepID=UPI0004CC1EB7
MQYSQTTALITGASSGIGAEFARQLARRGADLVLVARRADALQALAREIRADTGRTVETMTADLAAERGGRLLGERILEQGIRVDTVVNCAGVGLTKAFEDSSESELRGQLRLDVEALVELCHALLPQLRESGRGALVNIGSLTGYLPVPGMAVYAAAKAFVVRFTEALAHELRGAGLTVLAVSPGPTRTGFYAASGTDGTGTRFQSAEEVVAAALRALDRRRPPVSIIAGRANRWTRRILGLLPTRVVLRLAESRPATAA